MNTRDQIDDRLNQDKCRSHVGLRTCQSLIIVWQWTWAWELRLPFRQTGRQTDVRMGVGSDAKEAPPLSHLQPFLLPYLSLHLYSILFYSIDHVVFILFSFACNFFFNFLQITYLSRLWRKWIEIVLNMGFDLVLKIFIFGSVEPKKVIFINWLFIQLAPSSSVQTSEHILTKYAQNK